MEQSQSSCRAVTGNVKAVGGGGFWRLEMRPERGRAGGEREGAAVCLGPPRGAAAPAHPHIWEGRGAVGRRP